MTFRHRLLRGSPIVLGALLLGSCATENDCLPTDPTCSPPVPGQLALEITTPNLDDRALVLTITGDFSAAQANSGYRLFPSENSKSFIVVSMGNMARLSSVLTLDVPDLSRRTSYSATVIEVAASDYRLRSDLSAYQMSFVEVSR